MERSASQEEKKVLEEFSSYCQPVELYNIVNERQARLPVFLRRNTCYAAKGPSLPSTTVQEAVYFRFLFDQDRKYVTEKAEAWNCPLCPVRCRKLWGLQQHMEASHSLFDYTFPQDHPDCAPAINVRCSDELVCPSNKFTGELEDNTNAFRKGQYYYCPKRLRKARVEQYDMPLKKRMKLPQYLTTVPKDVVLDDEEPVFAIPGSKVAGKLVAQTKERSKRVRASQQPRPKPPAVVLADGRQRFYHARSHTPMQDQEVRDILADPKSLPDSDDEEDLTEWKARCRRRLRLHADLSYPEREFMFNWNVYLHQHPVHADVQMPDVCKRFAQLYAEVLAKNEDLRKCFTVHLLLLWDYQLLDSATVDECMKCLCLNKKRGTKQPSAQ